MGLLNEAWETLLHLPSVRRSETAEYELLPEAEREVVVQIYTCMRPVWVYRGSCSTCTSPLQSAAALPDSPRTSRDAAVLRAGY